MSRVSENIKSYIEEETQAVSNMGGSVQTSNKANATEKYDSDNKKVIGMSLKTDDNTVQIDLMCKKGSNNLEV
jgi:hypothetical protein